MYREVKQGQNWTKDYEVGTQFMVVQKKKKKKVLKGCALHVDIRNIPPFSPLSLLVPSVTKCGFPSFQKENIDSFQKTCSVFPYHYPQASSFSNCFPHFCIKSQKGHMAVLVHNIYKLYIYIYIYTHIQYIIHIIKNFFEKIYILLLSSKSKLLFSH